MAASGVAPSACSTKRQSAFASRICSTVRQGMSSSFGLATRIARHLAREIATFSRLCEKRNSMLRGTSSPLDDAIEKKTTGASCPWNLSTVPTGTPCGSRASNGSNTWAIGFAFMAKSRADKTVVSCGRPCPSTERAQSCASAARARGPAVE